MLRQITVGAALIGAATSFLVIQRALSSPADHPEARDRCAEVPVLVAAMSANDRRLACSAAKHALDLLGGCGILPRRALRIQIISDLRHPIGLSTLGFFDAKHERALITAYENVSPLVTGTPYALLPQPDLYRSLIVHEVVHAVMHQNLERKTPSHAAHEYPAYVLQIASLPASVRDRFLQTVDNSPDGTDFLFSDSILFMDPFVFAARAYRHFSTSPRGCGHLVAVLQGEAVFILGHQ